MMNAKKMNMIIKIMVPLLLVLLVVLFIALVSLIGETTRLREECAEILECGNEILHYNDKAVKIINQFAISFDESLLIQHEDIINKIDAGLERMEGFNFTSSENQDWNAIVGLLDRLAGKEYEALALYAAGDTDGTVAIIQGAEYIKADFELASATKAFFISVSERIGGEVDIAVSRGVLLIAVFFSFIFITIILLIPLTNWTFKKLFWYETILDSIPYVISVIDNNKKFTFVNKLATDKLGRPREELLGQPCNKVWQSFCTACNTPACGVECFKRGETQTTYTADGGHFQMTIAGLKDKNGRQVGYLEFNQDVTNIVTAKEKDEELIKNATILSEEFARTSQEIASSSQAIAQGSTEQAATVEELSSSIQEIEGKTKANAGMAENAAKLSSDIKEKAERGSRQMDELMKAVQDINDASGQIEKVIKVIDDIAFQTNILALNAAVEAARAGSAGKGFAVVAEEVRNLASKSAEAAKNTSGLIEDSIAKSNSGMSLATETSSSLEEIVAGINQNAEIIAQIAQSSEEQATAIEQINTGVDHVASVVQQNSATSEESAAASSEMSREVQELENLLSSFKA